MKFPSTFFFLKTTPPSIWPNRLPFFWDPSPSPFHHLPYQGKRPVEDWFPNQTDLIFVFHPYISSCCFNVFFFPPHFPCPFTLDPSILNQKNVNLVYGFRTFFAFSKILAVCDSPLNTSSLSPNAEPPYPSVHFGYFSFFLIALTSVPHDLTPPLLFFLPSPLFFSPTSSPIMALSRKEQWLTNDELFWRPTMSAVLCSCFFFLFLSLLLFEKPFSGHVCNQI